MRAILPILLAVAACAATPRHETSYTARYDLAATSMVPLVIDASRAHHYRVALIEPSTTHARIVLLPTDRLDRAALMVHVRAQPSWLDKFATCLGSCSTVVAITPASGAPGNDDAHALLDEIGARAQTNRLVR